MNDGEAWESITNPLAREDQRRYEGRPLGEIPCVCSTYAGLNPECRQHGEHAAYYLNEETTE